MTPNLLHSLFSYRPRDGHTPEENFLTEAFAHTLRANPEVGRAWLASMTGDPLSALGGDFHVETQASFFAPDGKSWSIPDMVVRCDLAGGGELTVLSEHKWRSPADLGQIGRYLEIAAAKAKGHVVFIGSTVMQVADIKRVHAERVKAIRWQDVDAFLEKTSAESVREFADFLALQGLGATTPLSWPKLAAYVTSRSVEADCLRLVQSLGHRVDAGLQAGEWSFLPERFQTANTYQKVRWGRVGVELHDGHWPGLFLGLLLDGQDHGLMLVSPSESIDLMLSLDADPKLAVDPAITQRADALRATGTDVMHGAALKNKWRKSWCGSRWPRPSAPSRPTRSRSRRSTPGCGGGARTSSPTGMCGFTVRDRRCSATDRELALPGCHRREGRRCREEGRASGGSSWATVVGPGHACNLARLDFWGLCPEVRLGQEAGDRVEDAGAHLVLERGTQIVRDDGPRRRPLPRGDRRGRAPRRSRS